MVDTKTNDRFSDQLADALKERGASPTPASIKQFEKRADGVEMYDIIKSAGVSKDDMLRAIELQEKRKSVAFSALGAGTFLGTAFVAASPLVQWARGAGPTWKSFKAGAPRASAIGFAVGVVGGAAYASLHNANLKSDQSYFSEYVDRLEAARAAAAGKSREQGK